MPILSDPQTWLGLAQIALINIVLSIDNAIVMALVARTLPAHQQRQAVACGAVAVVAIRILLTLLAAALLTLPYLKLAGGLALVWIAIKLLLPQPEQPPDVARAENLPKAIYAIVLADLVMSVDNVLSVAAAAGGNAPRLIAGLVLSIPLVIFGATLLMRLMQTWPWIITFGAAVLGWVAGEMLITDPAWAAWIKTELPWMQVRLLGWDVSWAHGIGAILVVAAGRYGARRSVAARTDHT
jgi:YjbE family integral membrane protein